MTGETGQRSDGTTERPVEERPGSGQSSRPPLLSPRLTYLLIGGAALGVIVIMCLIVGLLIAAQGS